MTLDEIRQRYPNEWVLIEFNSLDDELRVTDGTVVAHSSSHEEIEKQLMTMRKERIAVEFTGECDTEESYFLSMVPPDGPQRLFQRRQTIVKSFCYTECTQS